MVGRRLGSKLLSYSQNSSSSRLIPSSSAVFGRTVADTSTTFSTPLHSTSSAYLAGLRGSNLTPVIDRPSVSCSFSIQPSSACIPDRRSNFLLISRRCLSSFDHDLPAEDLSFCSAADTRASTFASQSRAQSRQSSTDRPASGQSRRMARHSRREKSTPRNMLSESSTEWASSHISIRTCCLSRADSVSSTVSPTGGVPYCRSPRSLDSLGTPSQSQH